jgi:anti-sigma-K factor RskA
VTGGEHCQDQLGAYLLGACLPGEAERVAAHLAACRQCGREAERLSASREALLGDVAVASPGPQVKHNVMARVRSDAALFDAARRREADPAPARRRWIWGRSRFRAPVPVAAMACALLLAGVGGALLSSLGTEPREGRVFAAQIMGPQRIGTAGALHVEGERAWLRVRGLPQPGRGRVYQVWIRHNREAPRPSGATFTVDARGAGRADMPGDMTGVDQVLVTSEPAGGSPLPTRVPVLQVDSSPA